MHVCINRKRLKSIYVVFEIHQNNFQNDKKHICSSCLFVVVSRRYMYLLQSQNYLKNKRDGLVLVLALQNRSFTKKRSYFPDKFISRLLFSKSSLIVFVERTLSSTHRGVFSVHQALQSAYKTA